MLSSCIRPQWHIFPVCQYCCWGAFFGEVLSTQNLSVPFMWRNQICSRCQHYFSIDLRNRKASNDHLSLVGSLLAAIILDIWLICFIAKVVQEIAIDLEAKVLSGTYLEEGSSPLKELMSMQHLKWQEFFMWTILQIKGEGMLASALCDTHELNSMVTLVPTWIVRMPLQTDEAVWSLRKAKELLVEAERNEGQKLQEMRLCPHCWQSFMVLIVIYSSFVCGQDFHHNGQAQGRHRCR